MAKIVTLQPSEYVDHITDDGTEFTRLPYPFHVDEKGFVQRQDVWRGNPSKVIGFVRDPNRQEVDVWWPDLVPDIGRGPDLLQRLVGMYVITADKDGRFATQVHAIKSVRVTDAGKV